MSARERGLGVGAGVTALLRGEGHVEHLREVERAAVGALLDLVAATEPVGEHERRVVARAHRGQKRTLAARLRDRAGLAREPEGREGRVTSNPRCSSTRTADRSTSG